MDTDALTLAQQALSVVSAVAGGATAAWGLGLLRARERSQRTVFNAIASKIGVSGKVIELSVVLLGGLLVVSGSILTLHYGSKPNPVRVFSRNTSFGTLEALELSVGKRVPLSDTSDPEKLKQLFRDAITHTSRKTGLPFASFNGTPAAVDFSSIQVVYKTDGQIELRTNIYAGTWIETLEYAPKLGEKSVTFRPAEFDTPTSGNASVTTPMPATCDQNRTRPCTIPVWYATTRAMDKVLGYGKDRAPLTSPINYGVAAVVIPDGHDRGSTGSSWIVNVLRALVGGKGDEKLRFIHNYKLGMDEFWVDLRKEVSLRSDSADRLVLLYIHGFNVSFEDSMIRAGQLGYDLRNPGVTAAFTWPTAESVTEAGFLSDRVSIEAAEDALKNFVEDLALKSGATRIHIIAHSLGNQGLLRALQRIDADRKPVSIPIGKMILVAPAVDRQVFESLADLFPKMSTGTTLYVSSKDKVVKIGSWLDRYKLVGYVPPHTIVNKIDTVDVSSIQYDLIELGHSYLGAEAVLDDISQVLWYSATPRRRGLIYRTENGRPYWSIQ
jgi:esterase/lipase superfamily enzyme